MFRGNGLVAAEPAQQASGADWLPPFLSGAFDDPYDAVRLIAFRSMRSLPGMSGFNGDFLAPASQRRADVVGILEMWRRAQASSSRRTDAALLLNPDGSFKIAGVPDGDYTAHAWHSQIEAPLEQKVSVKGGAATLNFEFATGK